MATNTLGTVADDTLTAVTVSPDTAIADIASVQQGIKDDITGNVVPGALAKGGFLEIPNRGVLKVFPGDVVAIDNLGWPILVSAASIADGTDWDLD